MNLNKTATYALKATIILAKYHDRSIVSSKTLASEGDMPERFLLGILSLLVKHRILESHRGIAGGYRFLKDPREVSLLDIIEATQGPLECGSFCPEQFPEDVQPPLRAAFDAISRETRNQLATVKLADVVTTAANTACSGAPPVAQGGAVERRYDGTSAERTSSEFEPFKTSRGSALMSHSS